LRSSIRRNRQAALAGAAALLAAALAGLGLIALLLRD
jgi:hypothetical protein